MIEESVQQRTGAIARSRVVFRDRFAETYPGIVSWIVLLAPVWLSLLHPLAGIVFVMLATGAFMIKVFWYGTGALRNRSVVRMADLVDWGARLASQPGWRDHRIVFLVRAFREANRTMLEASIQSILDSQWPDNSIGRCVEVVYATEATDSITPPIVESLAEQFADRIVVRQIVHPVEPNVLPGPSSAMHFVGHRLFDETVRSGGDPKKVVVADFDSDTRIHPGYLACLLATFVADPNRDRRAYQPMVMFTLDYWSAPVHSRVAAIGTSALTLGWNRSPEIAFTGAAASLSTLESVDFWPTLSHSQDSGVELRLRMKYGEAFTVIGLPLPTYVYPVMMLGQSSTFGEWFQSFVLSFRVLFRQSARWREGPLDEFIEAVRSGSLSFTLLKLWSGIERDTLTVIPGYGYLAAKAIVQVSNPRYDLSRLDAAFAVLLSIVTVLGLCVFWSLLSDRLFVEDDRPFSRKIVELLMFYLAMPVLLPVVTACAGLKTSTAYALGKKPTGAYVPTPK